MFLFYLLFLRKNGNAKYLNLLYSFDLQRISRENLLMLYCCKDYKNVTRDKKFLQSIFLFAFGAFEVLPEILKYKKFFKLGARKFRFRKCKKLFILWFRKYKRFLRFPFPKI